MFSRETYIERRARLVADMKYHGETGLLLFLGNDESGMNYTDNTYPYRQDSTFLYFGDGGHRRGSVHSIRRRTDDR